MKRSKKSARREQADNELIPRGRRRAVDNGGMLDIARCPICDGPMTPRLDRRGPYFYCFCHARREEKEAREAKTIDNRLLLRCDSSLPLLFPSCNNNLSSVG
jgi:hypothetical protein